MVAPEVPDAVFTVASTTVAASNTAAKVVDSARGEPDVLEPHGTAGSDGRLRREAEARPPPRAEAEEPYELPMLAVGARMEGAGP